MYVIFISNISQVKGNVWPFLLDNLDQVLFY